MISIVIPTFNEERYLPALLESIKKQSFKDYEIIVADNFSIDSTRKIALDYGCRVVDGGWPAAARDRGAASAKYDILFLDSDVVLPAGFLAEFTDEIHKKILDVCTCSVLPISSKISHRVFYAIKNLFVLLTRYSYAHANGQC
jgi:glycosyltransferase involved in cell wall biosynthesis